MFVGAVVPAGVWMVGVEGDSTEMGINVSSCR